MAATGPLFDGGALDALEDYRRWTQDHSAHTAEDMWLAGMDATFRAPTGFYESTVHVASSALSAAATDEGTIYNYWLEGHGSRNAPVTRFPGYHNAEHAASMLSQQLPGLVDPIPHEYMSRMGA